MSRAAGPWAAGAAIGLAALLASGGAPAQTSGEVVGGGPTAADDPYRLTVGDTLEVRVVGEEGGWSGPIDIDGVVRLPGAGRASVEGLTLDEAEARLGEAISASGLYVAPVVSVALTAHAPVLVTGDVRDPGAFAFVPHLTAQAAAGLAGGVSLSDVDPSRVALLSAELAGELRAVETEIQRAGVRIARLDAQLAGRAELPADAGAELPLVGIDRGLAERLREIEGAILREEAEATDALLALWRGEIGETESQIGLLVDRVEVLGEVARLQAEELDAAMELDARGLRTRVDMTRIERSEAEARARLLEVEAALSQARSRRSSLQRSLTRFEADRRAALRSSSVQERTELELLLHRRRTVLEKRLVIGDGALSLDAEDGVSIDYAIRRRRGGGVEVLDAEPDAEMRPGDALTVTVALDEEAQATN